MDAMNLLQFIILFREINLIAKYLPQVLIHHNTKVIHNCIRKVFFFSKKKRELRSVLLPCSSPQNKKLLFLPRIFDRHI